jgi:Rrf2 family protein
MQEGSMFRLSKLSDYAIVLMSRIAGSKAGVVTARGLSEETDIPWRTVVRLLKTLTAGGVLRSIHGRKGGYVLSRSPSKVSLIDIIEMIEGPFALTECNRETGTPPIAGALGLAAAIEYLNRLDRQAAASHERELLDYATARLRDVPRLRIIGEAAEKVAVVSFEIEDIHAHDVGTVLDSKGIAVRAGHHCAMPLMESYGLAAVTRASMAFYNTRDEVDRLADAVRYAREVLA